MECQDRELKRFAELLLPVVGLTALSAVVGLIAMLCGCGEKSLTAMGELLLVVVIAIGEFWVWLEIRETVKNGSFQSWVKAQEIWTKKEFVDGRERLFLRFEQSTTTLLEEDIGWVKDTCRRMDEFYHLAIFLGEDKFLDVWGNPVAKAWVLLEDVVATERDVSGWGTKWHGFEEIGQKALDGLNSDTKDVFRKRMETRQKIKKNSPEPFI